MDRRGVMEVPKTMEIDAQPILVSDIPRAPKRVMDRYGYTYYQCCTMPFSLLIFLHDCARMEEEKRPVRWDRE